MNVFHILISDVLVNVFFRRPKDRLIRKYNRNLIKRLEESGRHELAGMFSRANEIISSLDPEEVTVQAFDGIKLRGRVIKAAKPSHLWFLLAHGYKSSAERDFILQLDLLRSFGANVLLIDQRAHGKSGGKYVTFGVKEREDVGSWISFIKDRDADANVILYGISMGASTVLASMALPGVQDSVSGVIADCGYTSPAAEFEHLAVFNGKKPPASFAATSAAVTKKKADFDSSAFDTTAILSSFTVPALFVHGARDRFVLPEFSKKNYNACSSPYKRLLLVPDAAHAGSFYHDNAGYTEEIRSLVNAATAPSEANPRLKKTP